MVGTVDNVFKYGKCFHLSLSAKVTAHSRWKGGSLHGLLWDQVLAWSRRRCVEVGLMCIFTVKDGEKENQPTKPKPNNPYLATSFPAKHLCVWWVRLRSARCIQCDSSEHLASGVLEVVTAKITSLPVSTGGENGLGLTHRGDLLLGVCSCIRSWLSEVQTNPFCFYFRFSLLEDAVIFLPLLKKRFY